MYTNGAEGTPGCLVLLPQAKLAGLESKKKKWEDKRYELEALGLQPCTKSRELLKGFDPQGMNELKAY